MAMFRDFRRAGAACGGAAIWAGALVLSACAPAPVRLAPEPDRDWPFYGADQGGQRYSEARQVAYVNTSSEIPQGDRSRLIRVNLWPKFAFVDVDACRLPPACGI